MINRKLALSVFLLIAAVTICLLQYRVQLKLRRESADLREHLAQLTEASNHAFSAASLLQEVSRNSPASDDQFRELLRLRGELALLRSQQNESQSTDGHRPLRTQ